GVMLRRQFRCGEQELGSMCGVGTFAERTVVPEQAVVKIDESIRLDVAALVGCGVMTGVGAALNTAKVAPGSSVVVFGAGGVGVSAMQGARVAGAAAIVAVDRNPAKLSVARSFGATDAVLPADLDAAKAEMNGGEGFDYAFECIGHPATMRAAYDAVRRGGTCCVVGVGRIEEQVSFSAFEIFFNEKNLVGSYYGGADVRVDFHRVLRLAESGQLDLAGMIDRRLPLEEINEGIEALRAGEVVRQIVEL
ncbi:MAG: zinc-binding dehydrogenase, partial [bacterium]|nr:zinc-binding dehydrogenase [bacterium]